MEFGVAAFSAVVGVALSKLCTVKGKPETDATFIRNQLNMCKASMQDHASSGRNLSYLQTEWIAQVRRFAYDIEDCIDRFEANKTTTRDFARQISNLKDRTTEMRSLVMSLDAEQSLMRSVAHDQVAVVPTNIQDLPGVKLNCLLYLCLFPPNHHVRTKPLIRRWMAEGLVQGEQFAVKNLGVFINSSIVNSTKRSNNGKVKRCQPTGETLQYISQRCLSENFILFCDGKGELQAEDARRLSVFPSANGELSLPRDLSRLRTLAVFADLANDEVVLDFSKYGVLRVLDLKECAHLSEEHLRDIWGQVLMKYLSINLGSIDTIARQIGYLDQLETLDLTGSVTVTVFKEVLLLPKLKHLFGKFQLSRSDIILLGVKKFLKEKSVLETLAGFVIGARQGFPQLMSLMRRLRKVKIWCKSEASQENLGDISSAITKFIRDGTEEPDLSRSLSIDFEGCLREFVNGIHTCAGGILASLKMRGKLSQFPQFVTQLSAIEELCLSSTSLSWEHIRNGLSRVRGLKYLKLIEDNLVRLDILFEAKHLKAIERICIVCKKRLEVTITVPHLVSVHILSQDMHAIPDKPFIDMSRMANLKEVALHNQVDDKLKDDLRRAAHSHPNRPEILFIEDP